jgi:hypothetical protein
MSYYHLTKNFLRFSVLTLDYIFIYCYKCLKMTRHENTLFEEGEHGRGDGHALTWGKPGALSDRSSKNGTIAA